MPINDCKLIKLPRFEDSRGMLTFIENDNQIPFKINRIYYLYENKNMQVIRGQHAHKNLKQLFIAISGSFDIFLNDGKEEQKYHLSSKDHGLYVCPMIWRELSNFSSDAVCLVLASEKYDEKDYLHNFRDFQAKIY